MTRLEAQSSSEELGPPSKRPRIGAAGNSSPAALPQPRLAAAGRSAAKKLPAPSALLPVSEHPTSSDEAEHPESDASEGGMQDVQPWSTEDAVQVFILSVVYLHGGA